MTDRELENMIHERMKKMAENMRPTNHEDGAKAEDIIAEIRNQHYPKYEQKEKKYYEPKTPIGQLVMYALAEMGIIKRS